MVHEVVTVSHDFPAPSVTKYLVMSDPPSDGAVQLTVVEALPPVVAETPVGASGLVVTITTSGSSVISTCADPSCVAVPRRVATSFMMA